MDIGYSSRFLIVDLDVLFVALVFLLTVFPIMLILSGICKNKCACCRSKHESLSDSLRGNLFFRFMLEASLEIGICIGFQWFYRDMNRGLMNFDDFFNVTNSVTLILLSFACIFLLVVIPVFFCKTFAHWKDE